MGRPKRWSKHALLSGEVLDLSDLTDKDRDYLDELARDAGAGEDFYSLLMRVKGAGSYPLAGKGQVTRNVMTSPLYRVAVDIANRAGISQGKLAQPEKTGPNELLSVPEAAKLLGVSRQAVNKAVAAGKLEAERIGGNFAVKLTAVRDYEKSSRLRKLLGENADKEMEIGLVKMTGGLVKLSDDPAPEPKAPPPARQKKKPDARKN